MQPRWERRLQIGSAAAAASPAPSAAARRPCPRRRRSSRLIAPTHGVAARCVLRLAGSAALRYLPIRENPPVLFIPNTARPPNRSPALPFVRRRRLRRRTERWGGMAKKNRRIDGLAVVGI
uniref:Uncharacterized protein n=1 Tax=Leersia perrieri TaxID=77586 RepID=A0A0D9VWZ1_9ORYZ